ncbi:unnamed protein product [Linum trigynum]|uniref:Uncharacterized protein n=1 Tax=Linum trigynum TaxID=586398 RepID=A0AAV2GD72_9ROSI
MNSLLCSCNTQLSLESRKAEDPTDALQQADVAGASGIGLAGRQENKKKKKLKKRIKKEEELTLAEIAEEYHDGNECRRIGEAMRQWAEEYEFQRAQSRRRQIVYEEDPLAHWHTVDVSPLLDSPPVTP